MGLRERLDGEDLHLSPQLDGLPDEERVLRFQRARRDAFMRRPALGTVLFFLPMVFALPGFALSSWLALRFSENFWLLAYLPVGIGIWLGTKFADRIRARLIARELERDGPYLP